MKVRERFYLLGMCFDRHGRNVTAFPLMFSRKEAMHNLKKITAENTSFCICIVIMS